MTSRETLTTARFFTNTIPDPAATKEAGRPKFKEMECVEITHPADKNSKKVFPALEIIATAEDEFGNPVHATYASKFPEQYRAYKEGRTQTMSGTPLSAAPFLTPGRVLELNALRVHTVEQLAALDGQNLKNIGPGGRDLKNQAVAYIETSKTNADYASVAAENAALKARLEALEATVNSSNVIAPADTANQSAFETWDDEDLKLFILDATGARPQGNPKHDTLVKLADEANAAAKKKAA